jgi:hypothetical protein
LGALVGQVVVVASQVASQEKSIQAFLEPALRNNPCYPGTHMILGIQYSQFRELGPSCLLAGYGFVPAYGNLTMVPKVTSPTKAFSGKRLKLITNDSFSADKLSSSWQVSTT